MIGLVGLNHTTAPVGVRERFTFSEEEIDLFIRELQEREPFEEVVVLSTCNRTEITFSSSRPCEQRDLGALIRFLCRFKGVEPVGLREAGDPLETGRLFYTLTEEAAVAHLFQVAAGLNSMVLGENQVLGQLKTAYRISASRRFTGTVLNRLFHKAFEVGKTVRTETAINEGASSVGFAAVDLAARIFTRLPECPVLLVGAGDTGEQVLRSLHQKGCRHLHVTNRTAERSRALAQEYGAETLDFERLTDHLLHCDIVITATASPAPLVRREQLKEVMQRRHHRSLFLIDLSVPRDVEDAARELEGVLVYDLDDLQMVVARNRDLRRREVEKAGRIVERHTREFFTWLGTLSLGPTIAHLRDCFESISQQELGSLKNRLPEETYRKVEEFGVFLQGKVLGLIIRNLKDLSRDGRRLEYIDLVNHLFERGERP